MTVGSRYPIPARTHRVESTIQRSRFITSAAHAPAPEAAHAFIARVREEFPDATHHCWAFVSGPPGSTGRIGMSDDGEPHGTAGRPMLSALLHSGVGEIVAVCTRYYGGTKLGTGGLARAYGGGVKDVLASLQTEEKVDRASLDVTVGYADVDALQRFAIEHDLPIEEENFGQDVRLRVAVPVEEVDEVRARIADLTRGEATVRALGDGAA